MQDLVRMSLVQFNSKWLEPQANAKRMAEFVEAESTSPGTDIVVFPELANLGYLEPYSDLQFARDYVRRSEAIPGPTTETLGRVAQKCGVFIVTGLSQTHPTIPGVLYNSAVLIGRDGQIVGVHHKMHAALEEKNYFIAGNTCDVYDTDLGKIALEICYDVRFPELARMHTLKGAEIIISSWSSFIQSGRVAPDSIIVRCATRAMENAVFFAGCNRSGKEKDRIYYGRSAIADPSGTIVAQSDIMEEEVIRAELHGEAVINQRAYLTIFRDRRPELYSLLTQPL